MRTRRRAGFLLMEALVGFFLIFLSAITMLNLLQTSDRGYAEAAQATIALKIARQTLESVRAGSTPKTVGTQTLTALSMRVGKNPISFVPTVVVTSVTPVLLVRSQVSWSENGNNHLIELKTYVAP